MKRFIPLFLIGASLIGSAEGQSLPADRAFGERFPEYFPHEFIMRELADLPTGAEMEAAKRREAQFREKLFVEKTNKFVRLWRQFAIEYNEKNAFNIKKAKEISKAFHELEQSESWPKARK